MIHLIFNNGANAMSKYMCHTPTLNRLHVIRALLLTVCSLGVSVGLASAGTTGMISSQVQKESAKHAIIIDLTQDLKIFAVAAQKYTFENTGNVAWNTEYTTNPVVYSPFLLYAGAASTSAQAQSVCGFTPSGNSPLPTTSISGYVAGSSTADNGLLSWSSPTQYLPSGWNPAFSGTYCAVVTLNSPAAKEASVDAYYVAPNGTYSKTFNVSIPPAAVAYKGELNLQSNLPDTMWQPVWKPAGSTSWTQ